MLRDNEIGRTAFCKLNGLRFIVSPSASKVSEPRFSAGWVVGLKNLPLRSAPPVLGPQVQGKRSHLHVNCCKQSRKYCVFLFRYAITAALHFLPKPISQAHHPIHLPFSFAPQFYCSCKYLNWRYCVLYLYMCECVPPNVPPKPLFYPYKHLVLFLMSQCQRIRALLLFF